MTLYNFMYGIHDSISRHKMIKNKCQFLITCFLKYIKKKLTQNRRCILMSYNHAYKFSSSTT